MLGGKEAVAKTRQTAKRSMGGRFNHRELNMRTARKVAPAMNRTTQSSLADLYWRMQILGERTDVVSLRFIRATGKFVGLFEEERHNTKEWTLSQEEAGMLFGRHLPKFVKSGL